MRATLISIGMMVPSLQRLMVSKGGIGPCRRPATNSARRSGGNSGLMSETRHREQLVARVAVEARGALVDVEETPVLVAEVEGVVRHVRHLAEHRQIERRMDLRGVGRAVQAAHHDRTLLPSVRERSRETHFSRTMIQRPASASVETT